MTKLVMRERELLQRLDFALLKGKGIEPARQALRDFYSVVMSPKATGLQEASA